jgi:hypothetical protein
MTHQLFMRKKGTFVLMFNRVGAVLVLVGWEKTSSLFFGRVVSGFSMSGLPSNTLDKTLPSESEYKEKFIIFPGIKSLHSSS